MTSKNIEELIKKSGFTFKSLCALFFLHTKKNHNVSPLSIPQKPQFAIICGTPEGLLLPF
ncbi:hypothetical protein KKI93_21280 [Xenorhabdus bovienii]|uniref:hypothetical protein n=1 Tax=Xenorhabdus bovienii TaxID=40576 RepID=UPI0023B30EDE|nr:hypothetical protein [Xenorhabdus bovienii]MDE9566490.1 hypothetical protein [Xenorhabdus bovienii]